MSKHYPDISERIVNVEVEKLHDMCRRNSSYLMKAEKACCFSCCRIYKPSAIKEWVDLAGTTAICPHCGIDAVLPYLGQFPLSKKFLSNMHDYFFGYSMPASKLSEVKEARMKILKDFERLPSLRKKK